ncbi:hypothetical protein A2960_04260 [Candidatus Gottesmanbacteria bacterium RIFCSPLOWO2_01_FULL_39_12b]|uniref:Uncharacterized protein n=1 Tax=Candidatus Gottesmanbacteria bacterium RIFCSPLOWO2_01_FULL_39_12b TaxID=1798388 RepID=A0A1F6AS38_9BACT|nr:MAG: hypothetical protein A2960_04260 [Candidatus Gottesmanbacteria bacterium RIFCSPLOWO2_01_FULL_39_12b]
MNSELSPKQIDTITRATTELIGLTPAIQAEVEEFNRDTSVRNGIWTAKYAPPGGGNWGILSASMEPRKSYPRDPLGRFATFAAGVADKHNLGCERTISLDSNNPSYWLKPKYNPGMTAYEPMK